MHLIHKMFAAWAAVGLSACATVPPPQTQARPVTAAKEEAFVIAANPLAAQAGYEVLKRGGSAVDAAVAVQAMLSLVEPQSSGIGGGAFMTYFNATSGKVEIYDGREVAPAGATPTMLLGQDGKPLPFGEAVLGGRALGVTELKPKSGWYDYDAKYTDGMTEHVCPADIPDEIADACKSLALEAHRLLGCNGASRSDFRWDDERGVDGLFLLEVNTQPGMTPLSLVPEQAKQRGISYGELVERIIAEALAAGPAK